MLKILLILLLMTSSSFAEWDKDIPLTTDNLTDFPVDNQENLDRLELVLREYPKGITLTYTSGSTITASTGGIVCSDATGVTKKFRGNTSTTGITFADIDTGAEASNTTYYVYASCDAVATTAEFKISLSSTTPTGLTSYKRIGYFLNDGSSNITDIHNDGQYSESGTWASKSVDVAYQALTDGIVVGAGQQSSGGTGTLYGYTDSSTSPTTIRTQINILNTVGSSYSYSFPVKKGDYYKVSAASHWTNDYLYFLPTGQ